MLELNVIYHLLLLLMMMLLLLLEMLSHQNLSYLGVIEVPHLWPLQASPHTLLLLLLLESRHLLLL